MSASLAGVVFAHNRFSQLLTTYPRVLISFALGVFAVLSYSLFTESLELGASLPTIIVALIGGAIFLEIASHIIPKAHHHHGPAYTNDYHHHSKNDAHRMLLGDAIHNVTDGLILVPAFLVSVWLGIATAVGIFLHELVQEVAEFFVLREAGYTVKQALVRNLLVSTTIFIGVGIALFIVETDRVEAPLLAFASGGFLYVILRDLLPSIVREVRTHKKIGVFLFAALLGAFLMITMDILVPHEEVGASSNSISVSPSFVYTIHHG